MFKAVIGISSLLLLIPAHCPNHALAQSHGAPVQPKTTAVYVAMWSIDKKHGSYALKKRLMSRASVDKMVTDGGYLEVEPMNKGDESLLLAGDERSIIYFTGIGEFRPGRLFVREFPKSLVNTFNSDPKKVPFTSTVKFGLNGLMYTISAAVQGSKDGWDMQVYLNQERKKQLLCSYRQTADVKAALKWISDIDRDGRPDLLLATGGHHAEETTTLYLSTHAQPGAMVRAVARFSQGE